MPDDELLAKAYRQVIPLKGHARVTHESSKHSNRPNEQVLRRRLAATQSATTGPALSDGHLQQTESADETYRISGVSGEAIRRLRREAKKIRETLDLHGLDRDQARALVHHFIGNACDRGVTRVRIIHGQGHGSTDGASILRSLTRHWLTQMPQVLGYVTPGANDGGRGAVLILLRSPKGRDHL